MTNWTEIALANEDKIKQALREAFQSSIGTIRDSWSYKVILDTEGDVGVYLLGQNEHLMNESITIASFQRDTLENFGWELVEWLENDERTAFEKWMDENDYNPAWPNDSHVQEWNRKCTTEHVQRGRNPSLMLTWKILLWTPGIGFMELE